VNASSKNMVFFGRTRDEDFRTTRPKNCKDLLALLRRYLASGRLGTSPHALAGLPSFLLLLRVVRALGVIRALWSIGLHVVVRRIS